MFARLEGPIFDRCYTHIIHTLNLTWNLENEIPNLGMAHICMPYASIDVTGWCEKIMAKAWKATEPPQFHHHPPAKRRTKMARSHRFRPAASESAETAEGAAWAAGDIAWGAFWPETSAADGTTFNKIM